VLVSSPLTAGGAAGRDLQANAAGHEVERAGGAVEAASVVVWVLMAARQSALMADQ
jgi:hypothetical protein